MYGSSLTLTMTTHLQQNSSTLGDSVATLSFGQTSITHKAAGAILLVFMTYMADGDHDEDAVHSPPAVDQVWQQGRGPVQGLSKHDAHCWNPQQRLPRAGQQQLIVHIAPCRAALAVLGECHVP